MFMTNEVKGSDKKKSVTCKLKLRDKSSVLRRKVSEVSSREFQEREIQRGPRKNIIFSKISMINVLFERPLRIRQHFKHRLTRSPNIWTEFLDDVRMDEPEGVTLTDLLRRHIALTIIARKKRRGDQTNTKHWKLRGPCVIPMGQQAGQHLWLLLSRLAAGDRGAGSDPTRPGLSGLCRARAGYNNTAVASRPGTRPHHTVTSQQRW